RAAAGPLAGPRRWGRGYRRSPGTGRPYAPAPPAVPPARGPRCRRSWRPPKRDFALLAGGQLDGLVADEDADGCGDAGSGAEPHVVRGKGDVNAVAAVVNTELELLHLRRQRRVEAEHRPAGPHPGQATQHDVHRPGHRPEVHTLGGGPALNVSDVALQRLLQEPPGLLGLVTGQDPGGDHAAERGAVRGALEVIGDGAGELVGAHLVAEVAHQLA